METKLSIIILSWNTKELLKKCLESIVGESREIGEIGGLEVMVVDNGSTDGSENYINGLTRLRINGLKIRSILNKENLGFAKGNNIGIKEAKGKYIMLLNSDTIVKEGALGKLVEHLEKNPEIDIIGPRLLNTDGSLQANCGKFPGLFNVFIMLFLEHFGENKNVRWAPKDSQTVDWLMGAAFVARKEVFGKIGGLDEKIFMYMEEVDWFYRAEKAGYTTYFLKDAEIVHLGRGSSKTGKKEPIINIYKGIIYFFTKHKTAFETSVLKIMLRLKAYLSLFIGKLKNDKYLKETYAEVLKII